MGRLYPDASVSSQTTSGGGRLYPTAPPSDPFSLQGQLKQPAQPTQAQTINQNYSSGKINAGDAVVQDFGLAAKQTNEALMQPLVGGVVPNPIGIANAGLTGLANTLGGVLASVTDPVAKHLGLMLRNAVGANNADALKTHIEAVLNHPFVQKAIQTYSSPAVAGDLGAVGNVANLGATAVMTKAALESLTPVGAKVGGAASAVAEKIAPKPTVEGITGKITQGTPEEIPAQARALSTIDTSNVKTFNDLTSTVNDQIKANTKSVDTAFSKSTDTYTPQELEQKFKTSEAQPTDASGKFGSNYIKSNPVQEGLNQLSKFYEKTNSPADLARIKNLETKFNAEGLTPKEINDVAREHGQVLNGYNANGELASGLTKQAAENTRVAMKEQARGLMPDENTRAIDKQTGDLIRLRDASKEMATKVQQLENKVAQQGVIKTIGSKVGSVIGKVTDTLSLGAFRSFLKQVTGIGAEAGAKLDPIQLQNNLAKNLKLLDRLNAMTPKDAVAEITRLNGNLPKVTGETPKTMNATIEKTNTIPKELQPLAEEAKKYKSAEEFVKAQPTLYHGNSTEGAFKLGDQPTFLTPDKVQADKFANDVMYGQQRGGIGRTLEFTAKLGKSKTIKVPENIGYGIDDFVKKQADIAKKEGYRYIEFEHPVVDTDLGKFPVKVSLYPKEDLISKSQLTDIYNKATGKK